MNSMLRSWMGRGWAALALALAMSGCGGGGGGGGQPPAESFDLTVSVAGSGAVNGAGGAINCGAACSTKLAANTSVTLTAAPVTGHRLAAWGGACSGQATTCTVEMNAAKSVTAAFEAVATTQTLNVSVTGQGTVGSSPAGIDCGSACSASFASNASVTLTATPAQGQTLSSWGGACSGQTATCTVTMDDAKTVSATFAPLGGTTFALSVSITGQGSVSSNPAGIDCGNTCSASYAANTSVTLTAVPAQGQVLSAWGGACSGQGTTCSVTMTAALDVTAGFTPAPVGRAWGTAELLENSNDFNVSGGTTRALTAIGAGGDILVIWQQSDGTPDGFNEKVFSRRYVPGQGWGAAVAIPGMQTNGGSFSFITGILLIDASGNATWVRHTLETRRFTPTGGWSSTAFSPAATSQGFLASLRDARLDAAGVVHLLGYTGDIFHATLPVDSNTWAAWSQVSSNNRLDGAARIALSSNSTAVAVWVERNPGDNNNSIWANRRVNGQWQTAERIEEVLTNVRQAPSVAIDANGNALAAWVQGSSVYVNRLNGTSGAWSGPTEVDANQISSVANPNLQLVMAVDGRAVVLWNTFFQTKSMTYSPATGFAAPVVVADALLDRWTGMDQQGRVVITFRAFLTQGSFKWDLGTRSMAFDSSWSDASVLETGAGEVLDDPVCVMNDAGQAVCAWAQDDLANSNVRNSQWVTLLR